MQECEKAVRLICRFSPLSREERVLAVASCGEKDVGCCHGGGGGRGEEQRASWLEERLTASEGREEGQIPPPPFPNLASTSGGEKEERKEEEQSTGNYETSPFLLPFLLSPPAYQTWH